MLPRSQENIEFENKLLRGLKIKIQEGYPHINRAVISGIKMVIKRKLSQIIEDYDKLNVDCKTISRYNDLLAVLLDVANPLCENKKFLSELERALLKAKLTKAAEYKK